MFDILPVYNQFPQLGLLDNMVYDIIPSVESTVGNTTVNASIFSIDCMAIPEAKLLESFNGTTEQQTTTDVLQYTFQLDDENQATIVAPSTLRRMRGSCCPRTDHSL